MPDAPLLLTMGEPAGIGGEIAVAAWQARRDAGLSPFCLLDDPDRLRTLTDAPVVEVRHPADARDCFADALPVIALSGRVQGRPGHPVSSDAPLVIESITRAVAACMDGTASGMVTNPINKALLYEAGFRHPGHTEFVAELSGGARPVMMIAGPSLRVVPATIHIPLAAVPDALNTADLIALGRIVLDALAGDFGCNPPRVAFAGLNPHAGEGGALGAEDDRVIRPAVEFLLAEGHAVTGPLPADTMFHPPARARYDAAICMYHDQALIPVKTLGFDAGVNITLGLPIVRTSPDHGTALSLAGTGKASVTSMLAAIRLADEMSAHNG